MSRQAPTHKESLKEKPSGPKARACERSEGPAAKKVQQPKKVQQGPAAKKVQQPKKVQQGPAAKKGPAARKGPAAKKGGSGQKGCPFFSFFKLHIEFTCKTR